MPRLPNRDDAPKSLKLGEALQYHNRRQGESRRTFYHVVQVRNIRPCEICPWVQLVVWIGVYDGTSYEKPDCESYGCLVSPRRERRVAEGRHVSSLSSHGWAAKKKGV